MAEPTFTQDEPRSLRVPLLLALALASAAALFSSVGMRAGAITIQAVSTAVVPTVTSFKSDSIVVGQAQQEVVLFVAPTLSVINHRGMPVTLNDFDLILIDTAGAQWTAKAMSEQDIASVEQSFPQLRPALSGSRLRPEQEVAAGASAKGTLLFSLRVTKEQWDARKSAVLNVDLYNQPPVALTIAK